MTRLKLGVRCRRRRGRPVVPRRRLRPHRAPGQGLVQEVLRPGKRASRRATVADGRREGDGTGVNVTKPFFVGAEEEAKIS